MNEEDKRSQTRLWTRIRGFLLWFFLLTGLAFIVVVYIGAFADEQKQGEFYLVGALYAGGFGTASILAFLFVRWLCCWRNLRRFFTATAGLAVLIGLFHLEEDWRGYSSWKKFKTSWEAKGEHFDMAALAPPAVPDEQNFAMTPIVVGSYYGQFLTPDGHRVNPPKSNVVNRLEMSMEVASDRLDGLAPSLGNWQLGIKIDLEAWQKGPIKGLVG